MSPRRHGLYARRHDLGHITPVQYDPVLVYLEFVTIHFLMFFDQFNHSSSFAVRRRPQVDIKEFAFLEKIFSKTQPEERTWAKLVLLKTIYWYCDGPKPMPAAVKYEEQI